jgi:PAS domain S-box-containing protein
VAVRPVLVIDDDAVSRHVLSVALAQAEMPHVALASGADALIRIDDIQPCLVLLDLVMPPPDGYEVLKELRSRKLTQDIPIVVLTALDADEEVARAFDAGADDFVRKPFKPTELVARIRGQLRMRGMLSELEKKERDAQLVLELTQALASNLDARAILDTVVERLAVTPKIASASVILLREPRDKAELAFVVASSEKRPLEASPLQLKDHPMLETVLDSRVPFVGKEGNTGVAYFPILQESTPMGVLTLRARPDAHLEAPDVDFLRTVTIAMAVALRNARVVQRLRDETQEVTVARFEAERRLRTLQRYADFFESGADGIVVIDPEGTILFSNPRAQLMLGYPEASLHGKRIADFALQDDIPIVEELHQGFVRGHFPQGVDVQVRRGDGALVVLSMNFSSVLREEGAIVCSFRDVTQERAVEAELIKTKDFLQRVIDSSADAIISADTAGRVLLANRAAERITGRTAAALLGTDVRDLYPAGMARQIMANLRQTPGGRVEAFRTELMNADKEPVPVALSATLLYEGDIIVGSVGIFTDLRERVHMELRLQRAQEQLLAQERQAVIAELAGAAAHELNQPLTSVMGYAELLKRRLEPGSAVFGAAEVIYNEAERMAEIVRKIGKITKYETKAYVGAARILDLDKASEDESLSSPPDARRE